jgi:hypothetical protein
MAKFREARLCLNPHKPGTSSFFDPISKLHLTKVSPVGITSKVTPAILRGLRSATMFPTLIDMDNRLDIDNKCFRDIPEMKKTDIKKESELPIEDVELVIDGPVVEIIPPKVEDEAKENKKDNKKDKSKKTQ